VVDGDRWVVEHSSERTDQPQRLARALVGEEDKSKDRGHLIYRMMFTARQFK
jgi:hypothetical protein